MNRVEGDIRTLSATCRFLCAQVEVRVHNGAGSWNSSELARWTNEVQRPDHRSNRGKHRTVKGEVEQTILALLETRPCRAVILLGRLVLKGDGHARPVWVRADESEERCA